MKYKISGHTGHLIFAWLNRTVRRKTGHLTTLLLRRLLSLCLGVSPLPLWGHARALLSLSLSLSTSYSSRLLCGSARLRAHTNLLQIYSRYSYEHFICHYNSQVINAIFVTVLLIKPLSHWRFSCSSDLIKILNVECSRSFSLKFLESTCKLNVQLVVIDSIAYVKRHLVHLYRNWLVLIGQVFTFSGY